MSTPLSYIMMREDEGYGPASLFKKYKTEPERPLAAILSLKPSCPSVSVMFLTTYYLIRTVSRSLSLQAPIWPVSLHYYVRRHLSRY